MYYDVILYDTYVEMKLEKNGNSSIRRLMACASFTNLMNSRVKKMANKNYCHDSMKLNSAKLKLKIHRNIALSVSVSVSMHFNMRLNF